MLAEHKYRVRPRANPMRCDVLRDHKGLLGAMSLEVVKEKWKGLDLATVRNLTRIFPERHLVPSLSELAL